MTRFTRTFTLLSILICCSAFIHAASNITGLIKDADTGEPMMEAAVKLLTAKDSTFVSGITSDINGKFTVSNIKAGRYIISISYIGYSNYEKTITVGKTNLNLGEISIKESSQLLDEVSVVAIKTPIKVMEDTVEYNADSYHTQPNAVIEDLLKRLPGVEVENGKITANGKSVSKILVEGKEFFSDDPQVASKNLPANLVDKLQVVDRKSDMARLTGVDDGDDETVINLTFKKGMNQGWFGNIEGGYGSDDRYMGSFNINRFWDGNQFTILGNFNNINQLGFTDSNGNRFRRFGGNSGITESRALGINFNIGKEEIIRVGGDIMWSNTDAYSTNRTNRTYMYDDYETLSKINKETRDRGNNIRGDFRVLWKPDSFNTLEVRPTFSFNHNKSYSSEYTGYYNRNNEHASDNNSLSNSSGDSFEFGTRLIYSHSFKKHRGRSFSISGNYSHSNVKENETSFNNFIYYILEEDPDNEEDTSDLLNQYTDNHTWSDNVMGRFTWTEPLGNVANGNFLTFSYRANYRWNNADKLVYNIPNGYDSEILPPVGVEPDSAYSNRYRNDYFNQDIRLGYKKVGAKSNFEVGVGVVPQMSKSIFLTNSDKNIDRWVWNYSPFLRYRYKFSKSRSIQANYRGMSSQPSLTQLQPVADISNPTNIIQGNPNLDPSFNHNMMLRFQDFNMDAQRSIMLMADIQITQNSIVSKTSTDDYGKRSTTYENVNGVWNGRVMNMFSMPFHNKKWSFSNHAFLSANRNVGFNNGIRNAALTFQINESPGITFRPDNFELELRPQYTFKTISNSMNSQSDQTVHSYGGRFDGTYYTPWGLTLQSDIRYSANKGYSAGFNTKTCMWNASISQQFLNDKSLTLTLKVYDLLNQSKNINVSNTGTYTDESETNALTRYFMVTLSYRFNSFGKGNEPKSNNMMRGGFGGPGGHGGPGGGPGGPR